MKRTLFKLQRLIGRYPRLYYPLYSILGSKKYLAVTPDTEIVIEGFPRSANSFAVVAFENAQCRPISIAHHLHIPAQVIRGVQMGIPVMVLLREPVPAICSLIVREPYLNLKIALKDYINFYETILPFRDQILIAIFEDVTSNFGNVINNLNKKFSTDFSEFDHNSENIDDAFNELNSLEPAGHKDLVDESKVARPSTHRANKSSDLLIALKAERYKNSLEKAFKLYNVLTGDANGIR